MTALEVISLTPDEARRLTDRIKVGVEAVWSLVMDAYNGRAWTVLGYTNWDDYCTREFGTSRLRLPREEREEVVGSLRDAGLSIRAIAAATGVSTDTVRKAIPTVRNLTLAPTPAPPREDDEELPGFMDEITEPSRITGLNGKSYAAQKPQGHGEDPRRQQLPPQFGQALAKLRQALARVDELSADDRVTPNRALLGQLLAGDLNHVIETCTALAERLEIR